MVIYPPGFRVGHWTDADACTGCTVILCPPHTVGGCDVRGNSPGTRELALLGSDKLMQEVHALLLTGGSAFGLAAADGVMRYLEERGIGYPTPWGRVPIVPAAVLFDLNVGSSSVRPTADNGYSACVSASESESRGGRIGAGTGATVGKWHGLNDAMRGGIGYESVLVRDLLVTAIAAVNAIGDIRESDGRIIAGARKGDGSWIADRIGYASVLPLAPPPLTNTTLVAILTNAVLPKVDANRVAQRVHDGFARAIKPVHSSHDGDVSFVLASGPQQCLYEVVAEAACDAAADAIRNAVRGHL
jgi:L-aminopeptidase/D-esterase-like protein